MSLKKYTAFSLVEILVALIIVSVITAALAPVITKKLASAGITIIGGGSSGNTEAQWGEPRSQSDCDPYNALYIPKEMNGGSKSVCVTKYNAGDTNGPAVPASVTAVAAGGATCTGGNCCWKGQTGDPGYCSADDGGYGSNYSGCNRTVCQQPAAKAICSSWAPQNLGLAVKTWRLPKPNEAQGWISNSDALNTKKGANGLQLCNIGIEYSIDGVAKCLSYFGCNGAVSDAYVNNYCYPHDYWLDSDAYALFYSSSILNLHTGLKPSELIYYAFSTRCVTDNVPYPETIGASGSGSPTPVEPSIKTECSSVDSNCQLCTSSQCITCKQGYVMGEDGKCEESDEIIKYVYPNQPKNQTECNQWNSKFIPAGVIKSNRNVCITKWNAGDTDSGYSTSPKGPTIPTDKVTVVNVGTSCPTSSTPCCWKGGTSLTCENSYSPPSHTGRPTTAYSGCKRTVCNTMAAEEICSNYAPTGTNKGDWRLPTISEFHELAQTMNAGTDFTDYGGSDYLKNIGSDGLQFCDNASGYGVVQCTVNLPGKCPGVGTGECFPYYVHIGNNTYYSLLNGVFWGPRYYEIAFPASVRCVYDPPGIPAGETNTGLLISTQCSGFDSKCQMCMGDKCLACKAGYVLNEDNTCTKYEPEVNIVTDKKYLYPNQPKSQADCDPYNAKFIHSAITGHGRNICMSKWNAGDNDNGWSTSPLGPTVPLSVTVVNAGSSCDIQNVPCCWKGQTVASDDCTTSWTNSNSSISTAYTGCKRTVCDYQAAEEICNNYAPSGTNAGDWRIPTVGELNGIANVIARPNVFDGWGLRYGDYLQTGSGSGGLQFCDLHSSTKGAVYCYPRSNSGLCPNAYEKSCRPYALYAQKMSNGYLPYFDLQEGSFMGPRFNVDGDDMAVSVRCVYDPPGLLEEDVEEDIGQGFLVKSDCSSVSEHCSFCSGGKCLVCKDGYTLDNGACSSMSHLGEPRGQYDCDMYNAVFIPKKYNGELGKNLCVTKYNIEQSASDLSPELYSYSGSETENLLAIGETATRPAYTCFKGDTADDYTDASYDIESGRIRTVCGFKAYIHSYGKWRPNGSVWTSLKTPVVQAWIDNYPSSTELKNKFKELLFCTYETVPGYPKCVDTKKVCKGMTKDTCFPYRNWVTNEEGTVYKVFHISSSGNKPIWTNLSSYSEEDILNMAASGRVMSYKVWLR